MTKSYISQKVPNPNASPEKRLLQALLFLPLILPLVPLAASPTPMNFPGGGVLGFIVFVLLFSLILGGVPYLLFLIGAFVWMRDKDADQVRVMVNLSPVIYGGVLFGCAAVFGTAGAIMQGDAGTMAAGFGIGMFLSIFAFFLGYVYVGCFNLVFVIYRRLAQERLR